MNKNKLVTRGAFILIAIALMAFFIYTVYPGRNFNANEFINRIREQNKPGLDSLQRALNYENDLNYRIEESIHAGDFKTAYSQMDSLPAFGRTHSIYLYKGMIYSEQKKYSEAIDEYTKAINEVPYSKAKDMRAEVYVKINKPELALFDYKEIFKYNHFYSYHIATTFQLLNKKDSALKYYQVYLEHYPNDTAVQQKIKSLQLR